jgi:hypothetical protein
MHLYGGGRAELIIDPFFRLCETEMIFYGKRYKPESGQMQKRN